MSGIFYGNNITVYDGILVSTNVDRASTMLTDFKDWTAWTIAVSSSSCTITTQSCYYRQFGDTVTIIGNLQIVKNTTDNLLSFQSLPVEPLGIFADVYATRVHVSGITTPGVTTCSITVNASESTPTLNIVPTGVVVFTDTESYSVNFEVDYRVDSNNDCYNESDVYTYNQVRATTGLSFNGDLMLQYTTWKVWTPTFSGGVSAVTSTTGTSYRQVGRSCELMFNLVITASVGATATINNLPIKASTATVATVEKVQVLHNATASSYIEAKLQVVPATSTSNLVIRPTSNFAAQSYRITGYYIYPCAL